MGESKRRKGENGRIKNALFAYSMILYVENPNKKEITGIMWNLASLYNTGQYTESIVFTWSSHK